MSSERFRKSEEPGPTGLVLFQRSPSDSFRRDYKVSVGFTPDGTTTEQLEHQTVFANHQVSVGFIPAGPRLNS